MNCLNKSSINIKVGKKREVGPGIGKTEPKIGRTEPIVKKTGSSGASMALALANGRVGMPKSTLKKIELIEWVDFLDSLANCLELS